VRHTCPERKFEPGRCSTRLMSESSGLISTGLPSKCSEAVVIGCSYKKLTRCGSRFLPAAKSKSAVGWRRGCARAWPSRGRGDAVSRAHRAGPAWTHAWPVSCCSSCRSSFCRSSCRWCFHSSSFRFSSASACSASQTFSTLFVFKVCHDFFERKESDIRRDPSYRKCGRRSWRLTKNSCERFYTIGAKIAVNKKHFFLALSGYQIGLTRPLVNVNVCEREHNQNRTSLAGVRTVNCKPYTISLSPF